MAINANDGTSYGSGTVTASTSNQDRRDHLHADPCYQRSAAIPRNKDVLIVRQTDCERSLAPSQLINKFAPGLAWDTARYLSKFVSTRSTALEMPTGCGLTFYLDATVTNRTNTNATLGLTAGELHQS